MVIETKFNVGDDVFLMFYNRTVQGSVMAFYYNSGALDEEDLCDLRSESKQEALKKGLTYKVHINDRYIFINEQFIFKTKEDLIQSL